MTYNTLRGFEPQGRLLLLFRVNKIYLRETTLWYVASTSQVQHCYIPSHEYSAGCQIHVCLEKLFRLSSEGLKFACILAGECYYARSTESMEKGRAIGQIWTLKEDLAYWMMHMLWKSLVIMTQIDEEEGMHSNTCMLGYKFNWVQLRFNNRNWRWRGGILFHWHPVKFPLPIPWKQTILTVASKNSRIVHPDLQNQLPILHKLSKKLQELEHKITLFQ
jgi:hypothetical protein